MVRGLLGRPAALRPDIADVERACIKYKLNMTIYDGKLAFVDQESRHIVATWGPQFKLSEEPEHGGE